MENKKNELILDDNSKTILSNEIAVTLEKKAIDKINDEILLITETISIIEGLSFQTNVLSLTVAVETVSAELVAQEVRSLAFRTTRAAKEIKILLENATNREYDENNTSKQSIKVYKELYRTILKTIELISDIESASTEQ